VKEFLSDVMTLFKEQCKFKDIELRECVSDRLPHVIFSDPRRIKQILMNMISNALKFTSQGYISVSIDLADDNLFNQRRSSIVKNFKFESPGFKNPEKSVSMIIMKKIKIVVEDTGVGIHKKDLEKLFK
jgi:signal transduction histidine kinase